MAVELIVSLKSAALFTAEAQRSQSLRRDPSCAEENQRPPILCRSAGVFYSPLRLRFLGQDRHDLRPVFLQAGPAHAGDGLQIVQGLDRGAGQGPEGLVVENDVGW